MLGNNEFNSEVLSNSITFKDVRVLPISWEEFSSHGYTVIVASSTNNILKNWRLLKISNLRLFYLNSKMIFFL